MDRNKADTVYEKLADEIKDISAPSVETIEPEDPKTSQKEVQKKQEKIHYQAIMSHLVSKNPDSVAYIEIPGAKTSYPVVQTTDNDYYLNRGFDKEWNVQGTIFMDKNNQKDLKDQNTVLYGHAMYYGTEMFGIVRDFLKQDYVDTSPQEITLIHEDGVYHYQIFSVARLSEEAPYRLPNRDPDEHVAFLQDMLDQSIVYFRFSRAFTKEDKILTLSTCTNDNNDEDRYAIFAILKEVEGDEAQ